MTVAELRQALVNFGAGYEVECRGCEGWELTVWKDKDRQVVVIGAMEPMPERESNP